MEGGLSPRQRDPSTRYSLNRRLGEPQKRSEQFLLLVFVQQYLYHPARDVIMSPEMFVNTILTVVTTFIWKSMLKRVGVIISPRCRVRIFSFFHSATASSWPGPSHYRGFTITLRHAIFGRTLLNECSTRRRDL